MTCYVYILANERNGTLYVGITNNIARRIHEHKSGAIEGFTKRHGTKRLFHIEAFETALEAIAREKKLKRWRRAWKLNLIEESNPEWRDLYDDLNR